MLLLLPMCYSLTVFSDAASQESWRGGISPGREVKCSHGTFHYLIGFIFYSPVKWSQVIQHPWGRVLGGSKTIVTYKRRQFIWLRMFKMSTTQTLALLELKIKEGKASYIDKNTGYSTGHQPVQRPSWSHGGSWGRTVKTLRLLGATQWVPGQTTSK